MCVREDDGGASLVEDAGGGDVETSTLKFVMSSSALPVKGSVPAWIAWMYCVFATPCLLTRYSVAGEAVPSQRARHIVLKRGGEMRTEEVVEVRVKVGDVALGGDEREHVPVPVRAVVQVPGVPRELQVLHDDAADPPNAVCMSDYCVPSRES